MSERLRDEKREQVRKERARAERRREKERQEQRWKHQTESSKLTESRIIIGGLNLSDVAQLSSAVSLPGAE